MKFMKLPLLLCLLPLAAAAQVYQPTSLAFTNSALTNAIPDNSTNTITCAPVDMRRYEELAVQVRLQFTNVNAAGAHTFYWRQSIDNTNWADHSSHVFALAGNGTNFVCTNLTLHTDALGWLQLYRIGLSSNGWPSTNLSILITPKPFRRERL